EGLEMRYESLGQADDQEHNLDEDIVGEWTGSEDVYTGETSDGEEMKKGYGKSASSGATVVALRHKLMCQGAFPIFPAPQTIRSPYPRIMKTSSRTPVRKRRGAIWLVMSISGRLITILVLPISTTPRNHFLIRAVHLRNTQHMILHMHTLVHPPTKMLFRVHKSKPSLQKHFHLATTPSTHLPNPSCSVIEASQVHGDRARSMTLRPPTHLYPLMFASLPLASLSMSLRLSSSRVDSLSDLLQVFPQCHRHQ
ncbi:hypothetical protein C0993_002306, partial [Termitomyces sp. T159_Od127]